MGMEQHDARLALGATPVDPDMRTTTMISDTETLFRQAPMTAHDYLLHAVHDIDEMLGAGYARAHPELIAAYMHVAAIDFGTAIIARAIEQKT